MTDTTETVVASAQATEKPEAKTGEQNGHEEAPAESQPNENGTTEEAAKEEDPPKEMRSIVLTGFGGYKGVKILKKPEPTAAAGEVLIRVKAW